ncbi:MAG: hypothetical protein CMF52_07355 [Legionellales bacterium]|nr:hypothetical protein [Legionellales bacterium]
MAYKFQVGAAILSGSLTQEGTVEIHNDAGTLVGIFDNDGVLSGALGATAASFTCDGPLTGGSLVVGAADMSEADLEKLDGITNGAGQGNKALVLDGSSRIQSGLKYLTASEGIRANEFSADSHIQAPAIIASTLFQGAAISGSGDLNANRLVVGGPNFANGLATIDDVGAATFSSAKVSDLTQNRLVLAGANGELADNAKLSFDGADLTMGAGTRFIAVDMSGSGVLSIEQIKASGSVAGTSFVGTTFSGSGAGSFNSLDIDGAVVAGASVTAGTSFVIGSADLNETDLEKLDGITNGVGAANKALVLNASQHIASGLVGLTASAGIKAEQLEATDTLTVAGATLLNGAVTLGNATSDDVTVTGFLASDVIVKVDNSVDLGSATKRFAEGHINVLHADSLGQSLDCNSQAMTNVNIDTGDVEVVTLNIDGATDINADLVDADLFVVDDGAGGTNRKSELTRVKKYIYSAISGDASVSDSGVLTISAGASDVNVAGDGIKLSSGYNYFTGSVSARCELPSGSIGTVVTVKAGNTAIDEAITITGSFSDTIDGATEVLLESPFAAVTCVYMRPGKWKIV